MQGDKCGQTGKTCFESPERGARAAKLIRRKSNERMYPYRCEYCRRWHLGHRTTGEHKPREQRD